MANEENIKDILVAFQAIMALDKGQSTIITSLNGGGSKSVRKFKRIA